MRRPGSAAWSVLALLAGTGCSAPAPAPPPPVQPEPAWTAYACADGRSLLAAYPDSRHADLRLDGSTYRLAQAVSGSGARFTGEGLQWWIKGDAGMLAPLARGEEIAAAPGVHCEPPSDAPVAPPEPGTPGGLPDDRTPLNERAAAADRAAGGAQAAATVLETYYALLESGRTAQAAALRIDGVAEDLRPYRTLGANIGAPGRIEGAAGSLFVEVPVVTYGRLANGAAFHRAGKATLRRVNDVPGSTAAQRTWRIDRIELE